MKRTAIYVASVICAAALCLLAPAGRAQSVGRVECPRSDGYVYLYSSMTTLEVRSTLQCGEQVQITGRFDKYFGVRTTKGDVGFIPLAAVLLIKDADGPRAPQASAPPSRERIMYDQPAPAPPTPKAQVSPSEFILRSRTVVHLKLVKALSSASAKLGDHVDLEVTEDVVVDGLSVVPKGALAVGSVTDVEAKKHMGHGGKVGVSLNSVRLSNNENAPVRGYQEAKAGNSTAGTVMPLVSGKDVAFVPGTDFTGWIDGDVHLKREAFPAVKPDAAGEALPQTAPSAHP
jgi:hypothetical protein